MALNEDKTRLKIVTAKTQGCPTNQKLCSHQTIYFNSDLRPTKLLFILDLIRVNINTTWKMFHQQNLAIL